MKDFVGHGGRLRIMPIAAKWLYTSFLLATLVGLWVSYKLYLDIGKNGGICEYYHGNCVTEKIQFKTSPSIENGPQLDIDVTPKTHEEKGISNRHLLEITHFHLFSIPVFVLIIAHLWLLTGYSKTWRFSGTFVLVFSSFLHIAAPWLVKINESYTSLMPLSGLLMTIAFVKLIILTLLDMWQPFHTSR